MRRFLQRLIPPNLRRVEFKMPAAPSIRCEAVDEVVQALLLPTIVDPDSTTDQVDQAWAIIDGGESERLSAAPTRLAMLDRMERRYEDFAAMPGLSLLHFELAHDRLAIVKQARRRIYEACDAAMDAEAAECA